MEWMPGDKLTASLFLGKASRHVMGSTRVPTTNLPIQRGPGGEEPPPRALSAAKCRPRPGRSEQRPRGAAFICSPLPHTLPPPPLQALRAAFSPRPARGPFLLNHRDSIGRPSLTPTPPPALPAKRAGAARFLNGGKGGAEGKR